MRSSITEPWSGKHIADIELFSETRAKEAISASVTAFEQMRALSSYARREILRRVTRGIEARFEELATLITREAGKPIALARAEVTRAISTFEIAAEEATRITGEVLPLDVTKSSEGFRGEWSRFPRGPVLAISPFNFPLNLVAHKVAPALACGCSVVLKPAPQAPLTSLLLETIVRESGAPENALQVVPCDVEVAEAMVRDDRFATLSFTGSARAGWHLKAIAGKKQVILELGGNAAAIVHDDANLSFAADRVTAAAFGYAGQVCVKVQRAYLHAPIADALTSELVTRARALAPTDPIDPKSVLGSMIDEGNAKRVESWIAEAKDHGAVVLAGGKRDGAKMDATILQIKGDGRGLKVVDEEVFGPVLTLHTYDSWDEALTLANASRYGLQAGIFTDSHARIRQAFSRLAVGGLIVGDAPSFRVDSMPYGGTRDSGFGREGVRFAIEEMTERKLLVYRF